MSPKVLQMKRALTSKQKQGKLEDPARVEKENNLLRTWMEALIVASRYVESPPPLVDVQEYQGFRAIDILLSQIPLKTTPTAAVQTQRGVER